MNADLDEVLAKWCKDDKQRDFVLEALCISWFGKIFPRWPRSDRGCFHELPERVWSLTCRHCGTGFDVGQHGGVSVGACVPVLQHIGADPHDQQQRIIGGTETVVVAPLGGTLPSRSRYVSSGT